MGNNNGNIPAKSCDVYFKVKCDILVQNIKVIGNIKALGNWNEDKGYKLF